MFDKSARSVLFVLLVIGVALSHPRKGDHHRDRNDKDKNPPTFEQCNLSINGRLYQFNPQENEITNTKDKEGDVVILNMCGNLKNDDVQGLDCSEDSSACIVTPTADGHITYNFASQPSEFGELRRGCGKRRNEPRPDKRDLHKKRDDHDDDDEHKEKHHDDDDDHKEDRRMRMKKQGVYLTYPIVGDVKSGGRFTQDSKLTYIVHCDFESESYNVTDISISEDGSQVNVTVYSQLGCPIVEEDDEEVIEVPAIVPIFFLISTCGFCCLAFCLCRACCRRRRACRNKGYTRVATQESKNNTELQRISINASAVPFIVQPQQHPQMMPYLSPVPQYMNHNLPYFVPLAPMAPMVEDLTSQQIHDDERLARELQEQENRQ